MSRHLFSTNNWNGTDNSTMRRDIDDLDDGEFVFDEITDEYEELDLLDPTDEEDEESVEISMEIDADGNEVYRAEDARIPDSTSRGMSAEEAIEGMEDRRREYRDMLRRSRDDLDEDEELLDDDAPADGDGVNLSLEVDENGNEVWYANDPRVPGSTSKGLSAEEAVDGLEDRRSQYREMLKKSRDKAKKKKKGQ